MNFLVLAKFDGYFLYTMHDDKARGRPAGVKHKHPIQIRASDEFVAAIDDWRRQQPDLPSRSEAIRRLVEKALGKNDD